MAVSKLQSKQFWLSSVMRAVKTFAQAFVGTQVTGIHISYRDALLVSATAALVSVGTSVASADDIVPAPVPVPPTEAP